MMTSQILKFMDSAKKQKPKYFENQTIFSSNKIIHLLYIMGYKIAKMICNF